MIRIIGNRSTGKTRELFYEAKNNNAIIICKNPQAMEQKAYAYGIVGLRFVGYGDEINLQNEKQNYMVDEIEAYIQYILNSKLIGYTLTNEE